MRRLLFAVVMVAFAPVALAAIQGSRHDFSTGTSPNATYTGTSNQQCIYCHAPHGTSTNATYSTHAPLWNRDPTAGPFTGYTSDTIPTAGTPGSHSRTCLGCHDGTVAIGTVLNPAAGLGSAVIPNTSSAYVGTDLSNDHPIGRVYPPVDGTGYATAATVATAFGSTAAIVFPSGNIECSSCHEPHLTVAATKFLRMDNAASALCRACHTNK
jgi:predicted CXXCH cytochrome family protein